MQCAVCGEPLWEGQRFCTQCGAPQTPPASAPKADEPPVWAPSAPVAEAPKADEPPPVWASSAPVAEAPKADEPPAWAPPASGWPPPETANQAAPPPPGWASPPSPWHGGYPPYGYGPYGVYGPPPSNCPPSYGPPPHGPYGSSPYGPYGPPPHGPYGQPPYGPPRAPIPTDRPTGQPAAPPPWASPGQPAWQVQPGAALYGPPAARPAKKPKTLRVILFCLLGAALLGAGVYFGFFYRGGLLNSGPERAGKEIEALFEDFTAALKAGDYEAVEACLTPDLLARADGNMEDLIDTVAIFNNATLTLDDLSVADDEVSAVGTMAMTMNVLVELSAFYEVRFEKIETRWLIAEVVLLNSNFPFEDGFSFGEDFPFEDIFPFESFEGFEDFGPSFAEPETEVPVVHGG